MRSSQRSRFLVLTKRSPAPGKENDKGFSVLHIAFVTYGDAISFGKSLSPPSGVGYPGQDKPGALENVETDQKTRNKQGLKIMDRCH